MTSVAPNVTNIVGVASFNVNAKLSDSVAVIVNSSPAFAISLVSCLTSIALMTGADTALIVKASLAVNPPASVAVTVTLAAAVSAVAVPLITPSANVMPAGKSPTIE